ncbi:MULTISPECIES: hypothetical protein [Pseudomonas]|uniref:hypothetical protein n=1 Tax=Pseudomonas TaxID=286 RepID=UPI0009987900|nr:MULTISPECIES: hypothetical protein [Pseudomonas]NNA48596.1 hypothetical protein [Pseudomonas lactis]OOW01746.1 hypothetical protein MF6394_14215 [Pseudomonas sp. MF6394]
MSHNFKPGDLALTLVFDADIPQGSQVEIVGRLEKGQTLTMKGYPFVLPTLGWLVTHPLIAPLNTAYGTAELMPLDGGASIEQQKSRGLSA